MGCMDRPHSQLNYRLGTTSVECQAELSSWDLQHKIPAYYMKYNITKYINICISMRSCIGNMDELYLTWISRWVSCSQTGEIDIVCSNTVDLKKNKRVQLENCADEITYLLSIYIYIYILYILNICLYGWETMAGKVCGHKHPNHAQKAIPYATLGNTM